MGFAARVKFSDGAPPLVVISALRQALEEQRQSLVVDDLPVGRLVAALRAVAVEQANLSRVFAQRVRDVLDDALDGHDALPAAEPAKRRIGRQMGAADAPDQFDVGNEVSVVGVVKRAVENRGAQIRRTPGVGVEFQPQRQDAAFVIEADVVARAKWVALAGHAAIGVAVVDAARRAPGLLRDQSSHQRGRRGLSFLAAKPAAHALANAHHLMHSQTQNLRRHVLGFGRVLRRRVDRQMPAFARHDEGALGFKIQMFLPANVQRALACVGRVLERRARIAARDGARRPDETFGCDGRFNRGDGRFFGDVQANRGFGGSKGRARFGGDNDDRFALKTDARFGQKVFVLENRAEQIAAGHIAPGQQSDDAGNLARRFEIERSYHAVGDRTAQKIDQQFVARGRDVVEKNRAAPHMIAARLVRYRTTDGLHLHKNFSAPTSFKRP